MGIGDWLHYNRVVVKPLWLVVDIVVRSIDIVVVVLVVVVQDISVNPGCVGVDLWYLVNVVVVIVDIINIILDISIVDRLVVIVVVGDIVVVVDVVVLLVSVDVVVVVGVDVVDVSGGADIVHSVDWDIVVCDVVLLDWDVLIIDVVDVVWNVDVLDSLPVNVVNVPLEVIVVVTFRGRVHTRWMVWLCVVEVGAGAWLCARVLVVASCSVKVLVAILIGRISVQFLSIITFFCVSLEQEVACNGKHVGFYSSK